MTDYARAKAFLVSELVRRVHDAAYEWYGFTLAEQGRPEIIVRRGAPRQRREPGELHQHQRRSSSRPTQESLPVGLIINGWLHSHGAMEYRHFSPTDDGQPGHRAGLRHLALYGHARGPEGGGHPGPGA